MLNQTTVSDRILLLSAGSQRLWGSMSIEQMLAHCGDQIRICLGTKPAKNRGNVFTRTVAKWAGLYLPMPLPKNMKTFKEINPDMGVMTNPTTFANDQTELLRLVDAMETKPNDFKFWHPVLGNLSKAEMINLTYKHLDHHLKQFGV